MKRCSTCQHWLIGAPDALGLLRTVVNLGSREPLGACQRQEFPRMAPTYFGGDCGALCERWEQRAETRERRAEMVTLPEVLARVCTEVLGSDEEGGP